MLLEKMQYTTISWSIFFRYKEREVPVTESMCSMSGFPRKLPPKKQDVNSPFTQKSMYRQTPSFEGNGSHRKICEDGLIVAWVVCPSKHLPSFPVHAKSFNKFK